MLEIKSWLFWVKAYKLLKNLICVNEEIACQVWNRGTKFLLVRVMTVIKVMNHLVP
jgi:hypothetical protein